MTTNSDRRARLVWGGLVGVLALIMATVATESALHFFGPPIDGPFQLYNALRRIAAGQHGGADFQFFHGIGLPYLHYVPFRLLGGGFTGSELSRQLVTAVAYPLVLVAFFWVFTRDWSRTFALSALIYAVSIAMRLTTMIIAVNSLLGVRSAVATLVPATLLLSTDPRRRGALAGMALGVALLFGTEQGLAATGALLLAVGIAAIGSADRRGWLVTAATALGTMIVVVIVATLCIGGFAGLRGSLYYNLVLMPREQYWYFGAPPSFFIARWSALPIVMRQMPRVPEVIALAFVAAAIQIVRLRRAAATPDEPRAVALATLSIYGLLSCTSLLGMVNPDYVQPCTRVLLLMAALELDRILPARDARLGRPGFLGVSRTLAGAVGAALIVMTVSVTSVITALITTLPHVVSDHIVRREGITWQGVWPAAIPQGQAIIDAHRGPNGAAPTLWSTYAGLIEAKNGLMHPSFDYIIHAIGPKNRTAYIQRFVADKPTLVQTVLPSYNAHEVFIEQTSWGFYQELLRNYRVVGSTPWSVYWERADSAGPPSRPVWSSQVAAGADSVELPSAQWPVGNANVALIDVELEYRVRNPLHILPVIGALPRYFVSASNAISRFPVTLDPYTITTHFPLIVRRGSNARLLFETYSLLPGASFAVSRVSASIVPVIPANVGWFTDLARVELARRPLAPGAKAEGIDQWR